MKNLPPTPSPPPAGGASSSPERGGLGLKLAGHYAEFARNRERLESADARPGTMVRMGMVYRTWDKMDSATRQALLDKGDELLANVDVL